MFCNNNKYVIVHFFFKMRQLLHCPHFAFFDYKFCIFCGNEFRQSFYANIWIQGPPIKILARWEICHLGYFPGIKI